MKKVLCIIGMIILFVPTMIGVTLVLPFVILLDQYNEEDK